MQQYWTTYEQRVSQEIDDKNKDCHKKQTTTYEQRLSQETADNLRTDYHRK